MKVIFFELNEVPYRILDDFCVKFPESNFTKILQYSRQYTTISEDQGHLSPWITWPSVHRGVADTDHGIYEFGQDLSEVDCAYPTVWQLLNSAGLKVGVFSSLHSYPLPSNVESYSFFVPDPFAPTPECFPKELETFQKFNLSASRAAARNVPSGLPLKEAIDLVVQSPKLGIRLHTFGATGKQILRERFKPEERVRRRTFQGVVGFDIFLKQLVSTKPDFATFFTNHVASAMHRYWAAKYPGDYSSLKYESDWIGTYENEIDYAMGKADEMVGKLLRFVQKEKDYAIWISTSMGQEAIECEPVDTQLYIVNRKKFMNFMGLSASEWESKPAMLPQHNFIVAQDKVSLFREKVGALKLNGEPIKFREKEGGFFAIDFGQTNLQESETVLSLNGSKVSFAECGLANVKIDDASTSSAYHMPYGILLIFDPKVAKPQTARTTISTLDMLPMVLRNFGLTPPSHLRKSTTVL